MYQKIPSLRALQGALGDTLAPGIYSVVVYGDTRDTMTTWLQSNKANVTVASKNSSNSEDHPWYEGGVVTDWITDASAYDADSYTFQVNNAVDWDTTDFGQPTAIVATPTPAVKITPAPASSPSSSSSSSASSTTPPPAPGLSADTTLIVIGGVVVLGLGITLAIVHKRKRAG
jgi:hypothetical protein